MRDPYFDNAKYLAIVLVVCGHLVEDLRDDPVAHALYFYVYLFHMPLFIVLSGYLSGARPDAGKLLVALGVPYVIFEVAYSLPRLLLYGKFELSLLDPYYLTWFLMSLLLWRLSTPLWTKVRRPLAIAVVVSLAAGTVALPDELSMNRTLGLLPFFVAGLVLRPEHLERLRRWRIAGAVVLAVGAVVALRVHTMVPTEWIRWRQSNAAIGVDDLAGSLVRLALLVVGAVLVAAFLAVTPARRTWFSGLGAATMYAYLLHGFVVKVAERFELGVPLSVVLGVVVATLLCTPPVRAVFRWAVEPRAVLSGRWSATTSGR
ncbi:acyltransferase family protein [Nonomuraea sp. NPDC050556]|uniref:acyltransferase family protein n=1 Tax=Nonomuraea sp. NPDC050556 TaxID=3364369 RepID=UPI00379D1BD2